MKWELLVTLIFSISLFSINFVLAVECGSVPTNGCTITQNTTFVNGTYNLPNGIDIENSNIFLDCNNSMIRGDNLVNTYGIFIVADRDYNTIKNCHIANYSSGIYLTDANGPMDPDFNNLVNNTLEYNENGIRLYRDPEYNLIKGNVFKNNVYGIHLEEASSLGPSYNNITKNIMFNNSISDVHISGRFSDYNNVWDNTINNRVVYGYTGHNVYVINGIENTYIGNATGPTSEGLYIYGGLRVNTNRTYIYKNYTFDGGIFLEGNGLVFDCKGSIFSGRGLSGTRGITFFGNDYTIIRNCNIVDFASGIYVADNNGPIDSDLNLITNNTLKYNDKGIHLYRDVENNTITNNYLENNDYGIYSENSGGENPMYNLLYQNEFVDNTVQAYDGGLNNSWNNSEIGNYWNDYDIDIEGCFDADSNFICDDPYNISGSAGSRDFLPITGIQILEIIPIQVIRDVDLVSGKTTLVRSVLKNRYNVSQNINVSLYFEGSLVDFNESVTIESNEEMNVDLWFVPDSSGENKQIKIEVLKI